MDAPIFIVGTPRSGTTLTARILGRHSRLFMPGEVHFFEDIYARRRELGPPGSDSFRTRVLERLGTLYGRFNEPLDQQRIDTLLADPAIRGELESSCGSYREILSFFMEIQARSDGKVRWGNNAPRDIFSMKEILAFYPNAKILLCIRDVRDFLVSYRDKWKVTVAENEKRLQMLYHPVITSLLWKMSARVIASLPEMFPGACLMVVRYEDLVGDPETMVPRICKFIGEEFEPNMLNVDSNNSSTGKQQGGIYATSVGLWRNALAKEEAQVGQRITRRELEWFGYSIERISSDSMKMAEIFLSTPPALWRALQANKETRGPLLPYMVRRMRPLLFRKTD